MEGTASQETGAARNPLSSRICKQVLRVMYKGTHMYVVDHQVCSVVGWIDDRDVCFAKRLQEPVIDRGGSRFEVNFGGVTTVGHLKSDFTAEDRPLPVLPSEESSMDAVDGNFGQDYLQTRTTVVVVKG